MPRQDLPADDQPMQCDHKGPAEFEHEPGLMIIRCGKCYAVLRTDTSS